MAHVINLFYPQMYNINHPLHNTVTENCLFCIDDGKSIPCFYCKKQLNKLYRSALCQFEFPEPDVQNSVQLKLESMTMDEHGHVMDEPYQCIHCRPFKTQASQN